MIRFIFRVKLRIKTDCQQFELKEEEEDLNMSPKLRHQESSRKERHLERKMQADDAAMEEDSQLPVSEALEVKRSNIEKSLDKVSINS